MRAAAGQFGPIIVLLALALPTAVAGADLRGSLTATGSVWPRAPLSETQNDSLIGFDIEATLEGSHALTDSVELVLDLRANLDSAGEDKAFADATEAALYSDIGDFRFGAGMINTHWGVLNAENLIDIFNQRDLVRDYQGQEHLGQPGLVGRYLGESVELEVLLSPYSRERRLAEGRDRYRFSDLEFGQARFEGGRWDLNMAGRLVHRGDALELGLSQFVGHSREPEFQLSPQPAGRPPLLNPFYRRIVQSGLDAQLVIGHYVLRGEALYRNGQSGGAFFAAAGGIERVFYGVRDSKADLLTYAEAYWDGRDVSAPTTVFDNDVVIGGTLFMNDSVSSEFEGRVVIDIESDAILLDLSHRRRINDRLTMDLSISAPFNTDRDPALSAFRRDLAFLFGLEWHF